jgi:hypothetical protein
MSPLMTGRTKKSHPASCPRSRFLLLFRFLGFLVFFTLVACQPFPRFTVETLPRYEALFHRPSGWTGGDGIYSAALGDNRLLWLFGDTLIGKFEDGRRVQVRLISNSVAIQTGREPGETSVDFFYRTLPDDRPAAFASPEDGLGWFWPYHAVRTPDGLYLFLLQVQRTDTNSAFAFKPVANWLGFIDNPDSPPDRWVISQRRVPWGNERRLFGSWVMIREGHCYIYGFVEEGSEGRTRKHMILARAPVEELGDFKAWRFFADGEWVAEVDRAGSICENVAAEFSVSFQPSLEKYVLVYSEGVLSGSIAVRLSPTPHGPWTSPRRVYRCPEAKQDPRLFCYAAKGHPEISSTPEELIVTYASNSMDFQIIQSDANLYLPKFLRIRFLDPARKSSPQFP